MRLFMLVWGIGLLAAAGALAADPEGTPDPVLNRLFYLPIIDLKTKPVQYQIDPKTADKFWEKWQLVTVRFRTDNHQQRFVYANPIAWKAMKAGAKEYPDGAMFAKLAFSAEEDPNFPASMSPNDFVRVQLMKKNRKQYADSDGWGYTLYADADIPTIAPDRQKREVMACHSCHRLVAKYDFVFSRPIFTPVRPAQTLISDFEKSFVATDFDSLSPFAQYAVHSAAGEPVKSVKKYEMRLFIGSMGESVFALAVDAVKNQTPYLLLDEERHLFLATAPAPSLGGCLKRATIAVSLRQPVTTFNPQSQAMTYRVGTFCDGKLEWQE